MLLHNITLLVVNVIYLQFRVLINQSINVHIFSFQ